MPLNQDLRYALRLAPPGEDPAPLAGCIEHVLSGRLYRFDDAAALVAWLQRELVRPAATAPPPA